MIFKLNDAFVVAFEHCHKKLQTAKAGSRNVQQMTIAELTTEHFFLADASNLSLYSDKTSAFSLIVT